MERCSMGVLRSLLRAVNGPRGMARAAAVVPRYRWFACCLLAMLIIGWSGTVQSAAVLSAPIAPQPLAKALVEFAHQTGLQLLYESKLAARRQSHEAPAGLPATDALTLLLQGTGLNFQLLNPKTVRIYEPAAVAPAESSPAEVPKPREEPQAHRLDTLEGILVTGTRRDEHLSDLEDVQMIPASVSVVSGASLEAQNAVQLSDYAANIPGLNVIGGGMPGASGVAIRSVSPLVLATSVAFYLDEVPIGASGRWGYAGGTALDLLPYDVERIEVQRGPQGTFGGAGAEIGSIKYVLNPPDASGFEARVGADLSTIRGAAESGESVRALVNAPIIDGLFAVRATAYDSYTPGYIDNAYSGATGINVLRQYGGRIAALWRPAESLSLTVMAFYNRIDQESPSEVLSPGVINVPSSGNAYIVSGVGSYGDLTDRLAFLSPFQKSLDNYSATLRWNPGFSDFMWVTGWSRNHEHYVEDYTPIDGSYFPALNSAVPAGLAEVEQDVYLDKLTEELRIASPLGTPIDWVYGAFYTSERLSDQTFEYAFDDSYRPIAAFAPYLSALSRPSVFKELALFADMTWEISDPFEVAAGIRIARDTQDSDIVSAGPLGQQDSTDQGTDSVITWMASARYRIVPTVMFYGRVATGNQPNPRVVSLGPAPEAETATNYEIGVKSEFLERRALMDLTLFHLTRDGMLASVYESGVFHGAADEGDATAKGLELTSSYSPFEGLKFGYNAAYTQCAFTHVTPDGQYQLTGFQLENVPKWDMSITVNYDWTLPNLWHAHAGGDFRSVGQEWAAYVESRSLGGYPTTELPSYTVLDLNAAFARGPLSLKFFARNLTDKRADLNSDVVVNDYNTPVQIEHYILQPRTLGVGFDYVF
jgi:iron complex outermembrane receptor protein